MKRLTCLLLVLLLIISSSPFVYAMAEKRVDKESMYVKEYMENVINENIQIVDKIDMQGLGEDYTFSLYMIKTDSNDGYVIINQQNWIIPECSTYSFPDILKDRNDLVYGGLFTYLYTDINGVYHSVETGKELSREEMLYLSEIEVEIYGINQSSVNKNALLDNIRSTRSTVAMTTGAGSTSWLYNTGSYYGDCGINCIAMVEKYYDLYINGNCLPSSLSTESQIKQSIYNHIYYNTSYPTGGLYDYQLADILTTHTISVGVNSYYLYAYAMNYNWATLCSRINSNLPCAMSVLNHPTYGDHFVVACGYTDTADYSTSKIYINTGWSSHGFVWIYQNYCDYLIPCV